MSLSRNLLAVAFLLPLSASAWAATPMGQVAAGSGSASGPGGSRTLQSGSDVFEGDNISVSGGGNVQIVLDDGTKLVVGPASRLQLKAYLRRNASTAKKVSIKAVKGTFRFITGNSDKQAYDVQTSNATIGIRGTGFDFAVGGKTLVAVHEGEVRLKGRNGKAVVIASGCEVGEAGSNKSKAQLLDGKPKKNALTKDFPYVINQPKLNSLFHLPVANCLPFLADAGSGATPSIGGLSPATALPFVLAPLVGGAVILLDKSKDTPVSADGNVCVTPLFEYPVCLDTCDQFCGTGGPPLVE